MNYNDLTRRHFETAAAAGVLAGLDTRRGAAGSLSVGTWVQFDVQLEPSRNLNGVPAEAPCGVPHGVIFGAVAVPSGVPELPLRVPVGGPGAPAGAAKTIRAVRFLAFGCPHVIAAADWIALRAVGMEVTGELPESVTALRERFAMPIEKLGRLLVIEDAWIAATAPPYDS